ncbi:serine/threonine-protein phosphatase Pgam5, mitochondrial [Dermacentor silvarum]|uniref:serine/threonine-protein phosphatase Pgam5, mitochondrial n=1 Tax=Dermacentor silvarum TaxID=543639 RepID=UPI002100F693|nr:serine/threonine-protein phosphatase Pgam5, mitochondrial [Dermacentor silvarum]
MLGHVTKAMGILCGSVAAVSLYCEESKKRQVHASWTTDFQPSSHWDFNWDRRDAEHCARPPADSSEEEKRRYDEEVQKAKATATRYLYLIRHGDFTFYEEPDRDRTLTELGRKQADLTGQRLKQLGIPFCQLTHSTMTRAVETAELIHRHLPRLPRFQCDLIREGEPMPPEPPFGIWKPQSKVLDIFLTDGSRIEAGFRKYFHRASPSQKQDSHEIIVCHANVIRYCICRALQIQPEAWSRMSLTNCSISVVKIAPSGRVTLRSLGDHGHLPVGFITAG